MNYTRAGKEVALISEEKRVEKWLLMRIYS